MKLYFVGRQLHTTLGYAALLLSFKNN